MDPTALSFGDWVTLAAIGVGWIGSFVAARTERVGFEVRLTTRFESLEEKVRTLAGADTRITVLETQRGEETRRVDRLEGRLQRLEGNVHALATERGTAVRQATPTVDPG